jgi:hypothetical protein
VARTSRSTPSGVKAGQQLEDYSEFGFEVPPTSEGESEFGFEVPPTCTGYCESPRKLGATFASNSEYSGAGGDQLE